jgi:cytochrome c oxidase subunit IV
VTDASHATPNDPHAPAHGGAHVSHRRTYFIIFVWLTVLTAIEVGLAVSSLSRFVMITLLCALAIVKAALVAMYFMHLRFERKTLALVVLTPIVLAGILIIGLMPDSQSWFINR